VTSLPSVAAEAAAAARRLRARLEPVVPAAALDPAAAAAGGSEKYTWVPDAIAQANATLRGGDLLADYNRYVLLALIAGFSADKSRYRLPKSVVALYPGELRRILRQVETFETAFFDAAEDGFRKDLAILTHRLIPIGAEYAEGGAGIPRRLLFTGGLSQAFKVVWLIAARCGGLRPFFALHAHTLSLERFNPEGWRESYFRLVELLELNPQMKGWVSASWFLDPALETISPHLAYLREVPVEGGAALMFVCRHPDGSSGALSKSATRRRLFAEGKYVPATYMRVWPRAAMLAWRQRQSQREAVGQER